VIWENDEPHHSSCAGGKERKRTSVAYLESRCSTELDGLVKDCRLEAGCDLCTGKSGGGSQGILRNGSLEIRSRVLSCSNDSGCLTSNFSNPTFSKKGGWSYGRLE